LDLLQSNYLICTNEAPFSCKSLLSNYKMIRYGLYGFKIK
jgi:hypothetical protein